MAGRTTFASKNQEQLLIQRLMRVPVLHRLTGKHLQVLLRCARTVSIEPGEALWLEGDPCRAMYILLKGQMSVVEAGTEVGQVRPVSSVGEISLLSDMPHDDEISGVEKCLLLEFPRDRFEAVLRAHSDICQRICRNIVHLLSLRLKKANERTSEIARLRSEIEDAIKDAEIELHDLNLIRGMRS